MEKSKDLEQEWNLTYKMYTDGLLQNPMINFWQNDQTYTQTSFFKFGFFTHTISDNTNEIPYIKILFILDEYRNIGIGKNLILQFLNKCKDKGHKFIKVEPTFESLQFWQRLGFTEIENDLYGQFILKL
jgi:GNAT superfamily N-acetyltransferase